MSEANPSMKFREAMTYAAQLHATQLRKGTSIPYLAHLLSVSSLVLEHGGSEDEAIAALLHDAIEDQGRDGLTAREIAARFGATVLAIVEGCTDAEGTAGQPKPPWRVRKEGYVAHLRHASAETRLVSAADKLHNARAILGDLRERGESLWARFSGGRDGVLWYYRALVNAYRQSGGSEGMRRLVDELDRTVTQMESLARGTSTGAA